MHQSTPFLRTTSMNNNEQRYFQVETVLPPHELYARIEKRIHRLEKRAYRMSLALFGSTFVLSSLALIPSLAYLTQEFSRSSFGQYLTLLSSDGDVMLMYWKELAFSLAESLPLAGVTLVLTVTFVLLYSLKLLCSKTLGERDILKARFA